MTSINNSEYSKYKEYFPEAIEKTIDDLKNNILMANYIAGKSDSEQLLSKYLENTLIDSSQIEEILKCIKIAMLKFNYDKDFDSKIFYYIFLQAYKENDTEIRSDLIEMSDIFMNTENEKKILEILCDCSNDLSYEECIGYIKLLRKISKEEIHKFKKIIKKLKLNANYNIRAMVEKYILKKEDV